MRGHVEVKEGPRYSYLFLFSIPLKRCDRTLVSKRLVSPLKNGEYQNPGTLGIYDGSNGDVLMNSRPRTLSPLSFFLEGSKKTHNPLVKGRVLSLDFLKRTSRETDVITGVNVKFDTD